jgi:hypothetical protein
MAIDSRLKDRELKDRKGCYVILVCIGSTNICTLGYTPILPIRIVWASLDSLKEPFCTCLVSEYGSVCYGLPHTVRAGTMNALYLVADHALDVYVYNA